MKRTLTFALGLIWFAFALGFGFFLLQYIAHGTGIPFSSFITFSGGALLGLVHFFGLCTAILICFAIGAGLCARAMVWKREELGSKEKLDGSP